jgi:hypothetical protein
MQKAWIEITGTTPFLMSAPNQADQFGPEYEYYKGCFYLDKDGIYIPGNAFEMALKEARKAAGDTRGGVRVTSDKCELLFNGPHDPDALYNIPEYVDRRPVRMAGEAVVIARPIFPEWGTEVEVTYNEKKITIEEIVEFFNEAGFEIGVGGYRQLYGKFTAKLGEQDET